MIHTCGRAGGRAGGVSACARAGVCAGGRACVRAGGHVCEGYLSAQEPRGLESFEGSDLMPRRHYENERQRAASLAREKLRRRASA